MDKLKQFLQGKPWYVKAIILIACAILAYFSSGCAYKMHVDHIDNMSREISISKFNK